MRAGVPGRADVVGHDVGQPVPRPHLARPHRMAPKDALTCTYADQSQPGTTLPYGRERIMSPLL